MQLTIENATKYVVEHFASYGEQAVVRDARLLDMDGISVVEVSFDLNQRSEKMGVWVEQCEGVEPFLYGEW